MNVLGLLENGLFALSQVLRLPVILLLWVCVVAALFMAGGCVVESLARRRERAGFKLNSWLEGGPVLGVTEDRQAALPAPLQGLLTDVEREHRRQALGGGGLEHVILEREEQVRRTAQRFPYAGPSGAEPRLARYPDSDGHRTGVTHGGEPRGDGRPDGGGVHDNHHRYSAGTMAFVIQVIRHAWVNETVREQRFLAERVAAELEQEG